MAKILGIRDTYTLAHFENFSKEQSLAMSEGRFKLPKRSIKCEIGKWYRATNERSMFLAARKITCPFTPNYTFCVDCKGAIEGVGIERPVCPMMGNIEEINNVL
jgi:hypothetical protein